MVIDYINRFIAESKYSINLIASENIIFRDAKVPFITDCVSRYTFDNDNVDLYFPGRDTLSDIEKLCCDMISELLDAKFVSVKPISGLNCMLTVIGGLTGINDLVYSVHPYNGGHGATKPMMDRLGLVHKFLPFDNEIQDVDYDLLRVQLARDSNVKMVYLDFMNILSPIDVARLRECLPKRTLLVYDASHVMGLILGKQFPNPLKDGADFLIGSTHKTFPGPHKGIIATNKAIQYKILKHRETLFISHHHMGDVVSLAVVLERYKEFGDAYSKQIVNNSNNLASILSQGGLNVQKGKHAFTSTHQIWIDMNSKEKAYECVRRFAEYGLILNAINLPYIVSDIGVRIGVQEITLCGYKEKDIELLGDLMLDIYFDRLVPNEIVTKRNRLCDEPKEPFFCNSSDYSELLKFTLK